MALLPLSRPGHDVKRPTHPGHDVKLLIYPGHDVKLAIYPGYDVKLPNPLSLAGPDRQAKARLFGSGSMARVAGRTLGLGVRGSFRGYCEDLKFLCSAEPKNSGILC
jgi:hypothetical protein